jgi:D-alanyl-D-alanine dipeptidase
MVTVYILKQIKLLNFTKQQGGFENSKTETWHVFTIKHLNYPFFI